MNISRRFILPPEAESILSRMTGNRKRRKGHVETMAADMREGRWVDTHEPIAMSVDGNLIDGQHRLAAVVLSGIGQWFWVAVYHTRQTAIDLPIDRGVQRTNADLLGLDLRVTRIANAVFCYGVAGVVTARPDQVGDVATKCREQIEAVLAAARTNKRIKGSAASRAAIVVNLLRFPEQGEELLQEFTRWNAADPLQWNSVIMLNKQTDGAKPIRPEELFFRVAKAFNPHNKDKLLMRLHPNEKVAMQKQICTDMSSLLFPEGNK